MPDGSVCGTVMLFHGPIVSTMILIPATALSIWRSINLVNLRENILPTRQRADLILRKGADHAVETVALRKL